MPRVSRAAIAMGTDTPTARGAEASTSTHIAPPSSAASTRGRPSASNAASSEPPRPFAPTTSAPRSPLPVFSAASVGEEQFYKHMAAGAVAGTTEHTAMFPLDTIKTRMQTAVVAPNRRGVGTATGRASVSFFRHATASVGVAASSVIRTEGVAGLYRGVAAVGIGVGPAHAVYFATYERMKRALGGDQKGEHNPLAHALAGSCATVVGDAVQTPVDTVKQRLQMAHSPYAGVWDCVRGTVRSQGFGALYRSYPTTLAMNVPFTAIHFTAYESAKIALGKHAWFRDGASADGEMDEETFAAQFAAGGLAGGLAAAATNPLDVVKTRMQTHCEVAECEVGLSVKPELQPGTGKGVCAITGDPVACKATSAAEPSLASARASPSRAAGSAARNARAPSMSPYGSSSLPAVMRAVVAEEGAAALLRGIGPRVLFHIPAGAISWATYEAGKRVLGIDGGGGHHH